MDIYNRKSRQLYSEKQYCEKALSFMYHTPPGRLLLKLASGTGVSRLYGRYQKSALSRRKIKPFIEKYGIDMSQFEPREYTSYAEFFMRQAIDGARPSDVSRDRLIAPADSKLTCYFISDDLTLSIKGSRYTVAELLGSGSLAENFAGGLCLVFRLTVDDYHHYCFCCSGRLESVSSIPGRLHTVSPVSDRVCRVYYENYREVSVIRSDEFGRLAQLEVGAMMVGKIVNLKKESFEKGESKGHFELGGSTVIVLLEKDRVVIDSDILEQSALGRETRVSMGEGIGTAIC